MISGKILQSLNISRCESTFDADDIPLLEYDGLENLAGYICNKLHPQIPDIRVLNDSTYTWVNHLNEGGLSKPTKKTMEHIIKLEQIFNAANGDDDLEPGTNFIGQLMDLADTVHCESKIKKLFFRARMFFRIRNLNKELKENSNYMKRKYKKIIT